MIREEVRRRKRTVIDAAIVFIVVLLIVQMWLLTATLETYLAGHTASAFPGMIVSGVIFAACAALYRFVSRIDTDD
jgi:hypothetical protein